MDRGKNEIPFIAAQIQMVRLFATALILAKTHSDFAGSFVLTILRGQT
jgi:hypothetical protein